jgi:hypothetical protein
MPVARRTRESATTAPPQAPEPGFAGWWRPRGGAWQPLVNGSTYDEVWRALHDAMVRGLSGDWLVLRVGKRP